MRSLLSLPENRDFHGKQTAATAGVSFSALGRRRWSSGNFRSFTPESEVFGRVVCIPEVEAPAEIQQETLASRAGILT